MYTWYFSEYDRRPHLPLNRNRTKKQIQEILWEIDELRAELFPDKSYFPSDEEGHAKYRKSNPKLHSNFDTEKEFDLGCRSGSHVANQSETENVKEVSACEASHGHLIFLAKDSYLNLHNMKDSVSNTVGHDICEDKEISNPQQSTPQSLSVLHKQAKPLLHVSDFLTYLDEVGSGTNNSMELENEIGHENEREGKEAVEEIQRGRPYSSEKMVKRHNDKSIGECGASPPSRNKRSGTNENRGELLLPHRFKHIDCLPDRSTVRVG
eukprot:CFRG2579T1